MIRLVTTLLVATLTAPTITAATVNRAQYLMGTVCEIAVRTSPKAEAQIDAAFAEAKRVEAMMSTWREASELSAVNAGNAQAASPELIRVVREALDWADETGGTFNPLVRPLLDAWKTRADGALPPEKALAAAMPKLSLRNVSVSDKGIRLVNGARLEEGAFGKGYALDRMIVLFDREAMIDFGGQVIVRGDLDVAIADPADRDRPVVEVELEDESISTSSGSEKTFEIDGERFSHIFDPRTGKALPPRGSVSVIAKRAMTADILSTALYVMGVNEGLRWADEHGVEAIFITPDHNVLVSSAVRKRARDVRVTDPQFRIKD